MTATQQQEQLLARAMKDEAFRQALLANPRMIIEHELGVTLPQGVTIQVHEETPTTVHFVLPPRTPSSELWKLDGAELERVAVDDTCSVTVTITACSNPWCGL